MAPAHRRRFVALIDLVAQLRPDVDPSAIDAGRVLIDGRFITNRAARIRADAALRVLAPQRLRGDIKLSHALEHFAVGVHDHIALDLGASAGGFTTALLNHGARRVYAVDVGVGQLATRLRTDPRVVNLEGHNLARIDCTVVADAIGVVTMDLSYLAASDALPQLTGLTFAHDADLVVLVKPTFELRAATLARDKEHLARAVERVMTAMDRLGWNPIAQCEAPATGRRGAREAFVHGRRAG